MALSPTPQDPGADRRPTPPRAAPDAPGKPIGVKSFLPNDLDPTVFDEGFLRQLERLGVLMKQPVRGGLKGGRRSVKRGQSVEFADYRDYSLGDDLRQLDWNVYARLEKLFVKLFVEEEDVTITFLLDASPSMAFGRPAEAAVREARGGGAGLHRARGRGPRRRPPRSPGGRPGATAACAARGACSGSWRNLSAIQPAEGPTDLARSPPATRRRCSPAAASSSCSRTCWTRPRIA